MAVPMRGLTQPSSNQFAEPKPEVITDINNPPRRNYNPNLPENQYPKMLYHHDTGKVLTVHSAREENLAISRHGFQLKPAPDRNYHTVKNGMVAPMKEAAEPREEELIAMELAEEDAPEHHDEADAAPSRRRR